MCPQIYSPIPISIDRANLSNISKNNAYPIILLEDVYKLYIENKVFIDMYGCIFHRAMFYVVDTSVYQLDIII